MEHQPILILQLQFKLYSKRFLYDWDSNVSERETYKSIENTLYINKATNGCTIFYLKYTEYCVVCTFCLVHTCRHRHNDKTNEAHWQRFLTLVCANAITQMPK